MDNNHNINNNVLSKKRGVGLIAGIVSAIVVVVVVAIFGIKMLFKDKINNQNLVDDSEQTNLDKNNSDVKWDDYELVIDGISIKLPMTYKEFMAKGFYIQDYAQYNPDLSLEDRVIKGGQAINSYVHQKALITNGTTNNISLTIHNPSNEDRTASESYIVGVYNEEPYTVATTKYSEFKIINHTKNTEIIVDKTTRDEVLDLFGDFHDPTDSSDKLTYYYDFNGDNVLDLSDVMNHEQLLGLVFDDNTGLLKITDFRYLNYGDLSN